MWISCPPKYFVLIKVKEIYVEGFLKIASARRMIKIAVVRIAKIH